jgi:hypothetical protein
MEGQAVQIKEFMTQDERIEQDAGLQLRRRELASSLDEEVEIVFTLLRGELSALLATEALPEEMGEDPMPFAEEITKKLHQLLQHAEGNQKVEEIGERIGIEMEIDDRVILRQIERTAKALYRATLRAGIDEFEKVEKQEEEAEFDEPEVLAA